MTLPRLARLLPLLLGAALAAGPPTAQVDLHPTFAGAMLVGRVTAGTTNELTGVWSPQGRARLLKCQPRCTTVQTVPFSGVLQLGPETPYRVVVSGEFRPGQRLKLALRFTNMQVLNVGVVVHSP
ncbi:hypothetical protein [Deinococcus hopiensis]|uniref:DUF1573 domain-containing protein n=1 Tax=Deinococcus hopiensis KR-140 TaxID=695939 RepID=A0A1W1VDE4_9DEIO|nr:hypothetical protein [Deinococcus hopiensis]SMB91336.1 hypothetical protein SAMN00790413_01098 [Deinococcus hopiensis KR-140]